MFIQDELSSGLTNFGSLLNELAVKQRVAAAKGNLTDGRLDHGKHSHGSVGDITKEIPLSSPSKIFFCW